MSGCKVGYRSIACFLFNFLNVEVAHRKLPNAITYDHNCKKMEHNIYT